MSAGKHRGGPDVTRLLYDDDFTPRHCAGRSCFHAHPGEAPLPVFASVSRPVPVCDRPNIHGSHDVTSEHGDFRCPGKAAGGLPAPRLKERVAQVRAAAAGGAR